MKAKILIVDDEVSTTKLMQGFLQKKGYQIQIKHDPEEALQLANEEEFDLVITDMTMPKMTGAELAREILAIRPDAAVILCSGYSELISAEKAKAMGISSYVMKPVTKSELSRAVRKVLDAKREIP